MIAKASGMTAAPAPCTPRQAISDQMSQASEEPIEPSMKRPRLMASRRSLPYWSPSLREDGRQHRGRQQQAREDPGRPGGGRVEVALDLRQGRHDHRLLHRVRDRGQHQGGQRRREVAVRPGVRHALRRSPTGRNSFTPKLCTAGREAASGSSPSTPWSAAPAAATARPWPPGDDVSASRRPARCRRRSAPRPPGAAARSSRACAGRSPRTPRPTATASRSAAPRS